MTERPSRALIKYHQSLLFQYSTRLRRRAATSSNVAASLASARVFDRRLPLSPPRASPFAVRSRSRFSCVRQSDTAHPRVRLRPRPREFARRRSTSDGSYPPKRAVRSFARSRRHQSGVVFVKTTIEIRAIARARSIARRTRRNATTSSRRRENASTRSRVRPFVVRRAVVDWSFVTRLDGHRLESSVKNDSTRPSWTGL